MTQKIVSIVIPCLNEEKTIADVLNDAIVNAKKYFGSGFEIVVADNGSTDNTKKILKNIKNIVVVDVKIKGYGAALNAGICKSNGAYVLIADADRSYRFSELKKFDEYTKSNYDLVLGNRLTDHKRNNAMPFLNRYFGTPLLSLLIRIIYRIPVYDCNSGMRLIRREFYKKLNMRNSGMEWASELVIRTSLSGGKYKEVAIGYWKDKRGRKPHMSRWFDGWRHLKAILLLKPSVLGIPFLFFAVLGIYFYGKFRVASYMLILMAIAILFSASAAWLINEAINRRYRSPAETTFDFFLRLPFVRIAGILSVLSMILIFVGQSSYAELRISIVALIILYDMWVFLIETIKTHLINSIN